MKVLVLGGYGLIGQSVCKRLLEAGHVVVGVGRSPQLAQAILPDVAWIKSDIGKLSSPTAWQDHLQGVDAVVNAAGALQSNPTDNLSDIHTQAITALVSACQQVGTRRFIQISAPGASESASTEFYRTKATGDQAIKSSELNWTIFRPALVLSAQAFGGTALIRLLAAFPWVQPIAQPDAKIQTVWVSDVADAVAMAVSSDQFNGADFDLASPQIHTLEELVLAVRQWLGFAPPVTVVRIPAAIGRLTAKLADLASYLGWHSALRSTAFTVLYNDVLADAKQWPAASGTTMASLQQTLRVLPSTLQERMFARASLVFPVLLILLAGFWLASGLIGLVQLDAAVSLLKGSVTKGWATLLVVGGSMLDLLIGGALLWRKWTVTGCIASIAVAITYLLASLFTAPALWADPLGPMIKIFPAIGLALAVLALVQRR